MWGAEVKYNVLTRKPSPSRFIYQYPLYTPGYATPMMVGEFLDDITAKTPLIVDTSPSNYLVPPINAKERRLWAHQEKGEGGVNWGPLPEMQKVFDFIDQHYDLIGQVGPSNWLVYRYFVDP